jgi:hypothetical protein
MPMGLWHMRRHRCMAAFVGRAGVTRHPRAFVKDFDDVDTQAHVELLLDQRVGDGVVVPVDFHVVINVDADQFPLGILIGLRGEWSERRTGEGLEQTLAGAGEFLEGPPVEVGSEVCERRV